MRVRTGFAALAVLLLAGCGAHPTPEPSLPAPTVPVVAPSELAAQKQAAGIEDCPRSDPESLRSAPACPTWCWAAWAAAARSGWPGSGAGR